MARPGAWKGRAVLAAALLLAACSGERRGEDGAVSAVSAVSAEAEGLGGAGEGRGGASAPVRREFMVLRELVKQHAAQQAAGNEVRVESVERHLEEWLARVPDEGSNEEEREILHRARELRSGWPGGE